jgi:type IV secretory pathway VirB2 component (pilin)
MVSFAMGIAVVIAVVSLILSGFKYILSFGDEDKVKSATQSMLYSLIGLALVFIAPAIVRYIISILLK